MELGMIGVGRMGANMVRRLLRAGHRCVVDDLHPEAVQALVHEGAAGGKSPQDVVRQRSCVKLAVVAKLRPWTESDALTGSLHDVFRTRAAPLGCLACASIDKERTSAVRSGPTESRRDPPAAWPDRPS